MDVELDATTAFWILAETRAVAKILDEQRALADQVTSAATARYSTSMGQQADVLPLRALLAASLGRESQDPWAPYTVEGCLAALAPFAAETPFAELARAFESTRALWPRRGAAELMAAGHPATFSGTHAIECLWDCEAETRLVGVDASHLGDRITRARIEVLAADQAGDQAVRSAAAMRADPPSDEHSGTSAPPMVG